MSEQSELIADGGSPAAVVVSQEVAYPVKRVWEHLISSAGAEALLGPGAFFGAKGQTWSSDNGLSGVVRTLHPMEELRFTIRRDGQPSHSMVQLDLAAEGDGTLMTVTHSNLEDGADIESLGGRWQDALGRIEASLAS